jgi:hypothetical protein
MDLELALMEVRAFRHDLDSYDDASSWPFAVLVGAFGPTQGMRQRTMTSDMRSAEAVGRRIPQHTTVTRLQTKLSRGAPSSDLVLVRPLRSLMDTSVTAAATDSDGADETT